MIDLTRGDLLDADAEALVNPVNCVGIMGKGLALQFRRAFPENFRAYAEACREGRVRLGELFVFSMPGTVRPCFLVNFPTKAHWRDESQLEDLARGLEALRIWILESAVRSIAVPALGCGLGGLRWEQVRPLIEQRLGDLDARVLLFEPQASQR
jgi:O-acetyl-ADP-ribose deacetylase (regulator of RNase III)